MSNLSAIMTRTSYIRWDDIRFVLDDQAYLDFLSVSSLKQEQVNMHVAALGHIIPIPI